MENSIKHNINSLIEIKDQCAEHLNDAINALVIAIESDNKDKTTIEHLADNVRNWMRSYHIWVNDSVNDIISSINCEVCNEIR